MLPMAEYLFFPSNVKVHPQNHCGKEPCFLYQSLQIHLRRNHCSQTGKNTIFSSPNTCKLIAPHLPLQKSPKSSLTCSFMGALLNVDDASSDWVPVVNQVLLTTSIFLTYIAGVVPAGSSFSQNSALSGGVAPETTSFSGRAAEADNELNIQFAWDVIEGKLRDALSAIQNGVDTRNAVAESEKNRINRPSSLFSVAESPRLRLLWLSFLWLKKEVNNIPGDPASVSSDDFSLLFAQTIWKSCQPLFRAWLVDELSLENRKADEAFLSLIVSKLKSSGNILQNVRKLGKEDLYAELAFVLKFGSLRKNGYYDHTLFSLHGVSMLEDLVITLADGVASMYLELISVDSSVSNEMNSLGLSLCNLSTRELQKLRNEVALKQWLYQNMEAVVSMYEDRFDLCTLQSQLIPEPSSNKSETFTWWKRLGLKKSTSTSSQIHSVAITSISVPAKRTKELRALAGWRYYFSLLLELADIAMPLIRTLISKVSDAISFFLVCLIGRSLGLIYTGIRQSLRWK